MQCETVYFRYDDFNFIEDMKRGNDKEKHKTISMPATLPDIFKLMSYIHTATVEH